MRTFDAATALAVSALLLWWLPGLDNTDGIEYTLLILVGSLLLPACGELLGLYQPWRGRSLFTMLGVYTLGWLTAIVLLSLFLVLTQSADVFSRLWMGLTSLGVLFIGLVLRSILYLYLRHLRASGKNLKRVLAIGRSENVERLCERLDAMPSVGYAISRRMVDNNSQLFYKEVNELVAQSAFQRDFDEIWLSYPISDGDTVRHLANVLVAVPANVRYFPDLSDVRLLNHRMAQVAGLYSLDLNYSPLNGARRLVKSVEDRVLGTILFLLFLPVMLIIALAIRISMGSPVLFKQYRHGIDGKRFRIYKFRTMQDQPAQDWTQQAQPGDPRITRLGAFLRRTSLDELPQLYNVLQGRMSLVGPRPHAMDHNEYYKEVIETYMQRHRVKPGMTGWAQVHGWRGNTENLSDMQKRVEYDLYYIDNWSLGLDIKILIMTLIRGFYNVQP
ncbi:MULTISPECIES: undecaprenyl-phosphate glucose phosphotransferase [Halomonadaceae]|uniref:undecaprenyl-phosphate glucose phosphotransferase n=1 Tax=Halomonadaceae TaxID=28256 RepID=UPI00159A2E5D|nr:MULTISPECIES: undecaprenyl-phosphate glucose phosphotransferase [Halomonas]QJQ96048.1 undecaprenyl-phosphate glucose phosphotransferase [Halomonas sp. PA5]